MSSSRSTKSWRVVDIRQQLGDGRVKLSSGYLVTSSLVLTCRHGVADDGDLPIEVRFANRKLRASAVLAWADPELDACLLRLDPAQQRVDTNWLSEAPERTVPCSANGYPRAVLEGGRRNLYPMVGRLHAPSDAQGHCHAGLDDAPEKGQFSGLSGAPIFVDDALAGIVLEELRGGKDRIVVLPVARLMEREAFAVLVTEDGGACLQSLARARRHEHLCFDRLRLRPRVFELERELHSPIVLAPVIGQLEQAHDDFVRFLQHRCTTDLRARDLGVVRWPHARYGAKSRLRKLEAQLDMCLAAHERDSTMGQSSTAFLRHVVQPLEFGDEALMVSYLRHLFEVLDHGRVLSTFELHLQGIEPGAETLRTRWSAWRSRRASRRWTNMMRRLAKRERLVCVLDPFELTWLDEDEAVDELNCYYEDWPQERLMRRFRSSKGFAQRLIDRLPTTTYESHQTNH